ncbi:condensation domain-containing protein [Kitasatospora sp. NPDC051853]|uniref:condensation domain-containing protein n=1 Tax=Kitasatospora sp. NPDC051853 TaxID=3364058 RepID=UPI0037BC7DEE
MHSGITTAYLARYRKLAETAGADRLLPLTGAQRRFLLTRRMRPQARPDTVPLFFRFPRGTVDPARLHRAALRLAARHPALRGRYTTLRGTPVLRLGEPSVEVAELAVAPGTPAEETVRRALLAWPAEGPVLRLLLAADPGSGQELLTVALDHAACDEQSLGLVTAGLSEAYAPDGGAPAAEDGLAAYREAVELQLAAEQEAASPAARAHWAARLGTLDEGPAAPAPTTAPTPTPEPESVRPTGALAERLPAVTGAARGAVFPALLDAVGAAGHRLLGTRRTLAVGYPWGGRPAGAAEVLGCFLNTLVHPAAPDAPLHPGTGSPGGLDALADGWWDDLEHAGTPFDEVVHAARSGGAHWSGTLDGLLTFEDLRRRPPLVLDGVAGVEAHPAGRPIGAPFAVAASNGERELLVRLVWDRAHCHDRDAEAAFDVLLLTLRHHLAPVPAAR